MPVGIASTKVVTGECRASYVHLLEPWAADPEDDKKFSVQLLIPKSDTKTLKAIRAAQEAALENGLTKAFKGTKVKTLKDVDLTLRDGDEEDTEERPELEGHYFMNVSAKTQPGVIDRAKNRVDDPEKVYSGVFLRASINAFPYVSRGKKGISFGLNNVQILRDGEPFGGRSNPESDFDELDPEDDDMF